MTAAPPRGPNPAASRRFPVVLTLVAATAFAILCGLGTWQLQRMHWKRAVLERIAATQARPPEPLAAVLARADAGEDVDFTRVSVDCLPSDLPASRVMLYGLKDGRPVWRPIAPCRIAASPYTVITVDRGATGGEGTSPPDLILPNPVHVEGVLRRPEARTAVQRFAGDAPQTEALGYFDRAEALAAVAEKSPGLSPAYMLVAESEAPAPPGVTPAPLPVNISNRHLEYVITWFGLAAALAAVYGAMLMRRLKP